MGTINTYLSAKITKSNTVYCGQCAADEFPVQISAFNGHLQVSNGNAATFTVVLCKSDGSNPYTYWSQDVPASTRVSLLGGVSGGTQAPVHDVELPAFNLKGQKIYIQTRGWNTENVNNTNGYKITIITASTWYTPVVQGDKIVVADINQTGTSITAGTKLQNSHFSAGTKVEASTFNSEVLGL